MNLNDMMNWVTSVNKAHGWFDKDRPFASDIALLHSEVSEAYEAYRAGKSMGITEASDDVNHPYDKDSIGAELADVLIRLLDTCFRQGIDLEQEFTVKMNYNEGRSYRHGGKLE